MKKENRVRFLIALSMLAVFLIWTAAVLFIDRQAVGPMGSVVGLATVNKALHEMGASMPLYIITDWLSLVPIGVALTFGMLGAAQWIKRKHISKVDRSIIVLGGFYIITLAVYILFEAVVINYRPVLIDGILEASYPSSTTVLVICVMTTAIMQLNGRIKNDIFRRCVSVAAIIFIAFMVLGRALSGVHWFSDIVGGVLLSAGLVLGYSAVVG